MSKKFVVLVYFVVSISLAELTYVILLNLVGTFLAIVAGVCMATLFMMAFCNMIGLPVKWD